LKKVLKTTGNLLLNNLFCLLKFSNSHKNYKKDKNECISKHLLLISNLISNKKSIKSFVINIWFIKNKKDQNKYLIS